MNFKAILFVLSTIIIFTCILCLFDKTHFNGIDEDESLSTLIFNRFYFVTSSFSTVGYGDVSPKSKTTKLIVVILQLIIIFERVQLLSS